MAWQQVMVSTLTLAEDRGAKGTTDMQMYIDTFQQISDMLGSFGTVFGFVSSDINSKIAVLREFLNDDPEHFSTLETAVEFEVETNTTVKSKKSQSASRCINRLQRALEFIVAFIRKVGGLALDSSSSKAASEAYSETLSKHHGWIVRKTVGVAIMTLGSKADLMKKMKYNEADEDKQDYERFCTEIDTIWNPVNELLSAKNLLTLA
eukprot:m.269124 g.269124  ORF g.269124 m.269124 type:complete len:207 (+) comp15666_c1_seq1:90-710(+)